MVLMTVVYGYGVLEARISGLSGLVIHFAL